MAWYHDRLDLAFHRRTYEEATAILDRLGLTGDFWSLDPDSPTP